MTLIVKQWHPGSLLILLLLLLPKGIVDVWG